MRHFDVTRRGEMPGPARPGRPPGLSWPPGSPQRRPSAQDNKQTANDPQTAYIGGGIASDGTGVSIQISWPARSQ
jgi:hypothetical protein